jgi:tetratricopeptide (TPR) repeat protein
MWRTRSITLALAVTITAGGCAPGGSGAGIALGTDTGGRYLVMIPALEGPGGDRVADELRARVMETMTHVAINERDIRQSMARYELDRLDETTSRQLASLIRAQLVTWGEVRQTGTGYEADVKFIDTNSGDEIPVQGATGATTQELAAAIFASFTEAAEGIRLATFCNDYLSSEQYDRALETCESALQIVPTSTTALYGKATALLYLDREEEAIAIYDDLLELDPTNEDALLGAGFAASRLGRSPDAMGYYRRYLEINPGNVQIRMSVASDVAQAGDVVSAFRILETAIAESRDDVDFQTFLFAVATEAGRRVREEGDTTTATEIFGRAYEAYQAGYVEGDAEIDQGVIRRVVEVTSALGQTEDAIRLAREATERYPNDGQLWSTFATALQLAGRTDEEIRALTRLAEIDPQNETVYARRAQAYLRAGQRQAAISDANRLAQRDPAMAARILYSIGAASAQDRNWAAAIEVLSAAHRHAESDIRGVIEYLWGASLLQQANAMATANTTGNVQQYERTIEMIRRSLQLLRASNDPRGAQIVEQGEQLLRNQEALLESVRRGG